jgi:hypothetical protein
MLVSPVIFRAELNRPTAKNRPALRAVQDGAAWAICWIITTLVAPTKVSAGSVRFFMCRAIKFARAALERPVAKHRPVLGAVWGAGIGMILLAGYGVFLAGTAWAIIVIILLLTATAETSAGVVRLMTRQAREHVRTNIALIASALHATIDAAGVSAALRAVVMPRLHALTSKAALLPPVRIAHRRIAHHCITARVVPAPISRA